MPRRSYTFRLLRAVWLWFFGSWAGRKWVAATIAATAAIVSVTDPFSQAELLASWSGFDNHIAPNEGTLTLEGAPGSTATCTVRGKTGWAIGDGWNFKGEATVAETSCKGRIEKDGSLSLTLELRLEWSGRIKGIGGDWEDIDGYGNCEGELTGTLAAGGKWEAKCKNDKHDWDASFEWKPDAD